MTNRAGFVSLIGRPNAGKSTLLNRMVGESFRSSAASADDRNRITGIKNLPGARVFVDTPGLYPADGKLRAFMLKTAHRAVEDVDVVCLVVDASTGDGPSPIAPRPVARLHWAGLLRAEQDRPRPRQEPDAAAHRVVAPGPPVRRDRPHLPRKVPSAIVSSR
jgi:hypothetical protein